MILARIRAATGDIDGAFDYLEKSLQRGFNAYGYLIWEGNEIAPLWEHKERWDNLMKKYFPDEYKD